MKSDLLTIIEHYLNDQLELRHFAVRDAAFAYVELVGVQQGSFVFAMGYHDYLVCCGVFPTREFLELQHIEAYRKFLAIHYGTIRLKRTFDVMRPFLKWCAANGYVRRVDTGLFNVVWPFKPQLIHVDLAQGK